MPFNVNDDLNLIVRRPSTAAEPPINIGGVDASAEKTLKPAQNTCGSSSTSTTTTSRWIT